MKPWLKIALAFLLVIPIWIAVHVWITYTPHPLLNRAAEIQQERRQLPSTSTTTIGAPR